MKMKVTKLNIHNNYHIVLTRTVAQNDIIGLAWAVPHPFSQF